MSIDEGYYKPIIAKSAFGGSYIQYGSKGDKGNNLSIIKYLNIIRPYLSDIINDHETRSLVRYHSGNKSCLEETSSEWKIQLTMAINFISSKYSDDTRTMHTKINNVEIMIGSETDEIIKDLFQSFLQKYQEESEESMRGSEFVYDSVDVLYYNLNKVILSRGGSYIDSPKWLKNKKATINPKNQDDKFFQYALTVALNSLNILYVRYNTEEIRHAYKSKYNLTRENQVILLMIPDGEEWHYLAVKSLSALFREITGNNHGDFYCLNCFQSYTTENKLKKHEKYVKIKIIAM